MKGVLELRQRDGSTVVAVVSFEAPAGAAMPDVLVYNKRIYHQVSQGSVPVFIESIIFQLPNPEPAADEANTEQSCPDSAKQKPNRLP